MSSRILPRSALPGADRSTEGGALVGPGARGRGRLPNDRPHMIRVMGSVDVPWLGVLMAANFQHFTGSPGGQRHCSLFPINSAF